MKLHDFPVVLHVAGVEDDCPFSDNERGRNGRIASRAFMPTGGLGSHFYPCPIKDDRLCASRGVGDGRLRNDGN
jgi:hypothetical protein